jgi:hypothetical protein
LQRLRPVATAATGCNGWTGCNGCDRLQRLLLAEPQEQGREEGRNSAAERGEAEAMIIVARTSGEGFAHVPIVCVERLRHAHAHTRASLQRHPPSVGAAGATRCVANRRPPRRADINKRRDALRSTARRCSEVYKPQQGAALQRVRRGAFRRFGVRTSSASSCRNSASPPQISTHKQTDKQANKQINK